MIYLAGDQKIHEWKLISHPLRGPIEIELCPAKKYDIDVSWPILIKVIKPSSTSHSSVTRNRTCSNCQELRQYLIWDSEGVSETEDKELEEMFQAADRDDSDSEESRGRKRRKDDKKKKRKSSSRSSPETVSSARSESEAELSRMFWDWGTSFNGHMHACEIKIIPTCSPYMHFWIPNCISYWDKALPSIRK